MTESDNELQLGTDDRFQRREWLAQRVGWGLWVAVLLAGCLGMLGPGWLSERRVTSADGSLTLEYERFLHHHNPTQLEVFFAGSPNAAGQWTVHVGQALLDGLQILRIEPEPVRQNVEADGASYTFAGALNGATGRAVFHVEYEHYGPLAGSIALDGGSPIHFSQFVYP